MGLACVLPKQVPQSHINRRDGAHLGTGKAEEIHRGEHVAPMAFDIENRAPHQQVGEDIMDHRGHRPRHIVGFAQPYQPSSV